MTGISEQTRHLQTTEVDGVPTFYVETGQTLAAALTFRVGLADETLPRHGWTHLLEHLAMHGNDDPRVHTNACVSLLTTEFQVSGDPSEVVAFFERLCRWLEEPTFEELEHERQVLIAEGLQRPPSDFGTHLDYRYGAAGVGLLPYRELGLFTATPHDLRELCTSHLVRENATLALNGPPPTDLGLPLRQGSRAEIPVAESLVPSLPCHVRGASQAAAFSGMVTDNIASQVLGDVLSRSVSARLRHEMGASYATTSFLERVDQDSLMLLLSSDLVPEQATRGAQLVSDTVTTLLADGIDREEFEAARDNMLRGLGDDPTRVWQSFNAARAALRGAEPTTADDLEERLRELTLEDMGENLRSVADTMLVSTPVGEESETSLPYFSGLPELAGPSEGTRYLSLEAPADPSVLTLSTGVCEARDADVQHRVDLPETVALLTYPDGGRTVVSRHGSSLGVEPAVWRHGQRAVEQLDSLVPAHLHVPMPERSAEELPVPRPLSSRLWRQVLWWLGKPWAAVLASVGVVVVAAVIINVFVPEEYHVAVRTVIVVLVAGVLTTAWEQRRARKKRSPQSG